jgi:hypothetical protein
MSDLIYRHHQAQEKKYNKQRKTIKRWMTFNLLKQNLLTKQNSLQAANNN